MKNLSFFLLLVCAGGLLTSCSDEKLVEISAGGTVPVEFRGGVVTKANGVIWNQDKIGVMCTSSPRSEMSTDYVNVGYSTDSQTAEAIFTAIDEVIYFMDSEETVSFVAYAPYVETEITVLPGDNGVIIGSTKNQSTADDQESLDYLYASEMSANMYSPVVNFTFNHCMSRLILNIEAGDNMDATDIQNGTYTFDGLIHDGKFNVTDGSAAADGDAVTGWFVNENCPATNTEKGVSYTMILFPQELSSSPLTFVAKFEEESLINSTLFANDLVSGYSYTYTIIVSENSLTLTNSTINDWVDGGSYKADGDKESLATPKGLIYSSITENEVEISWNEVPKAVNYRVTLQNAENESDVITAVTAETKYSATGLTAASTYNVSVQALSGDGSDESEFDSNLATMSFRTLIFSFDFSPFVWGGKYVENEKGTNPVSQNGAADSSYNGDEEGEFSSSASSPGTGDIFTTNMTDTYFANRGFQDWDGYHVYEYYHSIRIATSNNPGWIITPAFTALSSTPQTIYVAMDLCRYETADGDLVVSALNAGTVENGTITTDILPDWVSGEDSEEFGRKWTTLTFKVENATNETKIEICSADTSGSDGGIYRFLMGGIVVSFDEM